MPAEKARVFNVTQWLRATPSPPLTVLFVEGVSQNQNVAFMHTTRKVTNLIERIEAPQRITDHQKQARCLAHVRRQQQVHGAGDIGLDSHGVAVVVLRARARGFQQSLAGVDRIILNFAPRARERFEEYTVCLLYTSFPGRSAADKPVRTAPFAAQQLPCQAFCRVAGSGSLLRHRRVSRRNGRGCG